MLFISFKYHVNIYSCPLYFQFSYHSFSDHFLWTLELIYNKQFSLFVATQVYTSLQDVKTANSKEHFTHTTQNIFRGFLPASQRKCTTIPPTLLPPFQMYTQQKRIDVKLSFFLLKLNLQKKFLLLLHPRDAWQKN